MTENQKEVLTFVKENDIKFVRLAFCDIFGVQKNIAVMAEQLETIFERGAELDVSKLAGFGDAPRGSLRLFPDPQSMSILPWRPQQGRVLRFFCDVRTPDGGAFALDARHILQKTVEKTFQKGYTCRIGTECEFYLFKTDDEGRPVRHFLDNGGYLDVSPLDKGENIRREACLALENMGIKPLSSHHERGPGQNEIKFKLGGVLAAADNFISFKYVIKSVAALNGLYASFLPKPVDGVSGSGVHIQFTLKKDNAPVYNGSPEALGFAAGILGRIGELTLFLNPIYNSYRRFGAFEAPAHVTYSAKNEGQLLYLSDDAAAPMDMRLRSPDAALNPYIAFALLLSAGMEGIEKGALPDAKAKNPARAEALPGSLKDAALRAEKSAFARGILGGELFDAFLQAKRREAETAETGELFDERA